MKKILFIIFILSFITGCRNQDSIKFKNEFESLNTNSNYVKVNIESSNPFVYITDENLVKLIEDKQDLVVLFGYSKSNDTRSIIENLIKVSNKLNIDKIYYLDIFNIRTDLELNESGETIIKKEGSSSYNKLIELLDEHLEDYIIDGNIVGKRIYAPNILVIKDKEIKGIIKGKSYLESAEEKDEDSYNQIEEHLRTYVSNSCTAESAC